jgi:LacI family transcriptional regulator
MQDVADRAGVSLATASFAINGKPTSKASAETRARVLQAARELGYTPNALAQNLSRAASPFIGLIADAIATTPFAGALIRGAQDAAWEQDHILLVANTESDPRAEREALAMMLEHQVRGIVYSTWYHRVVTPPPGLKDTHSVLANCYARGHQLQAFVPDEVQGGRSATELLTARGHRRIAFINSSVAAPATTGRLQGYRDALAAAGIAYDKALVLRAGPEQEGGYQAGIRLAQMPAPPTAVFCYNDRVAMGLYDALRDHGLKIPDDMAVVGFDNQEIIAAHLRPPLTTVALPHYELGYHSVRWLLDSRPPGTVPARTMLQCPRIERSSA